MQLDFVVVVLHVSHDVKYLWYYRFRLLYISIDFFVVSLFVLLIVQGGGKRGAVKA